MSGYFIAQIKIHNRDEYQKYLDKTDDVLNKYNAEVIAVADNPTILEGKFEYTRMVIIRFPSVDDAKKWYDSPEYQDIVKYRYKSSDADAVIVEGRK